MEVRQVQLRVPRDIKTWLETLARLNGSSQNSEVIRALRAAMARDGQKLAAE